MGMGDALADVILEGRVARADSRAAHANADAAEARRELSNTQVGALKTQIEARMWKDYAKELEATLANTKALASAGIIVVNAMVKVMESMPASQREQFRENVARIARERIRTLDENGKNVEGRVSIEKALRNDAVNSSIRIV